MSEVCTEKDFQNFHSTVCQEKVKLRKIKEEMNTEPGQVHRPMP